MSGRDREKAKFHGDGEALLARANKKYSSSPGWFSSSGSQYEEAAELYDGAAISFKNAGSFKPAGDAYAKAADCKVRAKEGNDAANAWWNAAKAYKQGELYDLAVDAYNNTVSQLRQLGRFRQAADREKDTAELYGQMANNAPAPKQRYELLKKQAESFQRAGDWYESDDANATASRCYKDAADVLAEVDEFIPAINLYEKVANHSLTSQLTKYSVKEYWLRAALCALAAQDPVLAKRNMAKYASQDNTFPTTREARFADVLIDAIENGDAEAFTSAVVEYDQVLKLDNWKTAVLLKIKRTINDELSLS
ncbi:vesicular-fusion protein SEC17 [Auricularia subglabra TFB-10046 SS5]|nr:vesicular-fusion protein SEC17 [Auricularia subglabra TFB-10046 SS5]